MALVKIQNQFLTDVYWLNGKSWDYSIGNNVDIWRINVTSNLCYLKTFLTIMHPAEITRANRYFHAKDKNRFIISRGASRIILGRYLSLLPATVEFEIGANKKPYIKSTATSRPYYNISHSGDWILLAVSNSEIGADTEFINNGYGYKDVLQDNFSAEEISYIHQASSIERFFMLWTRKEALTKATGKGLDEFLSLIPCLDGLHLAESSAISSTNDWLISTFKLNGQYFASVATSPKISSARFLDISF